MIRKKSLIKAYKNSLKKENELIENLRNAKDFTHFQNAYEELTKEIGLPFN